MLNTAIKAARRAGSIINRASLDLERLQVARKGPRDYVTEVDRTAESAIIEVLRTAYPDHTFMAEESGVSGHTAEGELAANEWVIDPLDGTSNFANGRTPFAVMVALLDHGTAQAAWILDPISKRLCRARRNQGAWMNEERIKARTSGQSLPVAALATGFLPKDMRQQIETRSKETLTHAAIPRCAGEQYPRLVTGENDLALFWRTLPWDHAPGALFLMEAGGHIARFDGSAYFPAQTGQSLLAAASPALWEAGHKILIA